TEDDSSIQLGAPGDFPVPRDYDGDGTIDLAVWRPSTGDWIIRQSATGATRQEVLGAPTDVPAPADYDGDGKTDVATWRPEVGIWHIRHSNGLPDKEFQFGNPGDVPVPGDYDLDSVADLAVWRPALAHWYYRSSVFSAGGEIQFEQAATGGSFVQGDYDGDGFVDRVVLGADGQRVFAIYTADWAGTLPSFGDK